MKFYPKNLRETLKIATNVVELCPIINSIQDKVEYLKSLINSRCCVYMKRRSGIDNNVFYILGDARVSKCGNFVEVYYTETQDWHWLFNVPVIGALHGPLYIWSPIHCMPDIQKDMLESVKIGSVHTTTEIMEYAGGEKMPAGTEVKLVGFDCDFSSSYYKKGLRGVGLFPDGTTRYFPFGSVANGNEYKKELLQIRL